MEMAEMEAHNLGILNTDRSYDNESLVPTESLND